MLNSTQQHPFSTRTEKHFYNYFLSLPPAPDPHQKLPGRTFILWLHKNIQELNLGTLICFLVMQLCDGWELDYYSSCFAEVYFLQ